MGRCEPLPTAFTGLSVVNFHYTTKRKGTSLASYFVQCQFVISTKKFVLCLVAGDVGEGYFSVRTPRENGRKKRTETIRAVVEKRHHAASMVSLRDQCNVVFEDLWKPSMVASPLPYGRHVGHLFFAMTSILS